VHAFDPRKLAEIRAFAADKRDLRSIDFIEAQDIRLFWHRAMVHEGAGLQASL
jgi:hypothetical protein